jgi:small neutral amino acid transporter SnatA (MarC family)
MSFAFMVAAFLGTANAGRVALAVVATRPSPRVFAAALAAAAAVVVAAMVLAGSLLDWLSISPPSFRLAAGIVLLVAGLRTFVWPFETPGPFAAVLITPELVALALSFGADESTGRALAALVPALVAVLPAYRARRRDTGAIAARFLAALTIVAGVTLGVWGIRDV